MCIFVLSFFFETLTRFFAQQTIFSDYTNEVGFFINSATQTIFLHNERDLKCSVNQCTNQMLLYLKKIKKKRKKERKYNVE